MKKLINKIENALENIYKEDLTYKTKNYISDRIIGDDCSRKIWYSCHGYQPLPLTIDMFRKYIMQKSAEESMMHLFTNVIFSKIENFKYTLHIGDKKDFDNFKKNGIRQWKYKAFDNIQFKLGNKKLKEIYFFMVCFETGKIHAEKVEFDQVHYDLLKGKAESIMMMRDPPSRINESPIWFQCKKCQFRKECHR